MRWTVLESKMLSAAAYGNSKQTLYLRFRDTGAVYRFFEFTAGDHQAFVNSESKGRFFRSHIRDHFHTNVWPISTPPDFATTDPSEHSPFVVETF